jgi:poly(A) polymerase
MHSSPDSLFTTERGSDSAKIIPAHQHPITNDQIDRDALYILEKLSEAGFAGYLVGGGVRDLYLGKHPKDFDISTDARPGQLRKLFPHSTTIGRRFRLVQVFFKGGKTIEVSTLRSLSEHDLDGPQTVLAPNNTFGTLSEDARRRDLTINSLFYEIENGTIIDYVDGSADLELAIIRMVGDPHKRISRDPVRMMRAIRHAARSNFSIEPQTWEAIRQHHRELTLCPPSRLRDELFKDIYSGASMPWFQLADASGLFRTLLPLYDDRNDTSFRLKEPLHHQLSGVFATIDRLNTLCQEKRIHRQPDYFLLALILVPWADDTFTLYSKHHRGPELFQLARNLRGEIDNHLGTQLNLRRSLRQELVNLLINLAQLIHHKKEKGWPNWLKKKSYFSRALLLYRFYREATGFEKVTEQHLLLGQGHRQPSPEEIQRSEKKPVNARYKPAFSPRSKSGIFGFKKKR